MSLTTREFSVVASICDGLSKKEVADRLKLTNRTTEGILRRLKARYQCKNTTHLVVTLISNNHIRL